MAVRALGKVTGDSFEDDAFTRQFVIDKLTHYTELRRQHDQEHANRVVSRAELSGFIDNWLSTLVELDELTCTGAGCSLCARGLEA